MVRRSLCSVVAVLTALTLLSASAAAASAATPSGPTTIDLTTTKVGPILTSSTRYTLFAFTKDTPNVDSCVTTLGCTLFWPPILTAGAPIAGPGVHASLLGTIPLSGGRTQVTYNGHPLYGFIGDPLPELTYYIGASAFGGTWPAVTASGALQE